MSTLIQSELDFAPGRMSSLSDPSDYAGPSCGAALFRWRAFVVSLLCRTTILLQYVERKCRSERGSSPERGSHNRAWVARESNPEPTD
jgi:hypothetical protein